MDNYPGPDPGKALRLQCEGQALGRLKVEHEDLDGWWDPDGYRRDRNMIEALWRQRRPKERR